MYHHTQKSPLHWIMFLLPAMAFVLALVIRDEPEVNAILIVTGCLFVVIAFSFQNLTVADGGDHLAVNYGPVNLFGTRIDYRDITSVEKGKSALIDGWGIHFVPFRGWTMNLYGFECVRIERGGKVIRIGTDDSENLTEFLRQRIAMAPKS